jgi:magnesium chelatase family protein
MPYAVVHSRADQGLTAPAVRVEVDLANGLPAFTVVGMPETAVRESKDRVRSALVNSLFDFPDRRITVNLAPADLPKGGGRFDLPIALGILAASGQLPPAALGATECIGELALDGGLRAVRGAVAATLAATDSGRRLILPPVTAERAARVPGSRIVSAPDLLSLCASLREPRTALVRAVQDPADPAPGADLADVVGQGAARRALEIAAAGGHNLLFVGPPGTGKSLLASCLPGILPTPAAPEQLEILALHDLQGGASAHGRPFRAPHHSASAAALVGGGSIPRPGEVSLAHGGVLFLDELPEFSRHTLDMLREPLETGAIVLSRARCRLRYPARFQLVAAMNPCPCGYAGDPRRSCRCTPARRDAYAARVSGPLLDRLDLQLRVDRGATSELLADSATAESSGAVRKRVENASARQQERQGCANAQLTGVALRSHCALTRDRRRLLEQAAERLHLSARGVHRCLRVARTIADLGGAECIDDAALGEALSYRVDAAVTA